MKRAAIVAAFPAELRPLVRGWRRERRGGVDLWRHGGAGWIAACAGVGPDAALRALAEIEREGPVDAVISAGWAGALREEFAAGRAYRVAGVIDARSGERFPAAGGGEGWLVTSPRFAGREEKRRLAAAHDAGLVDMEAAALARAAAARGRPFHGVKGVSDGFADRLPDLGGFIAADGRFRRRRLIAFAVLRPWHWPALGRMGAQSRRAARSLAESLLDLLAGRR